MSKLTPSQKWIVFTLVLTAGTVLVLLGTDLVRSRPVTLNAHRIELVLCIAGLVAAPIALRGAIPRQGDEPTRDAKK